MNHMNRSALLVLHEYNRYANDLVLGTAAQLSLEQQTCPSSPSRGSVQGLLNHMLECETFFLRLCQGQAIQEPDGPRSLPEVAELSVLFSKLAAARQAYLEAVSEAQLVEAIPAPIGKNGVSLPRWQLIAQSLIHSGHHRGELSIVMTSLGAPLPTLDVILQFIQQSGQSWP